MTMLLAALALAAQPATKAEPLPKAEALPPPAFEDAEVLAAAQAIFAPLESGDGAALLALVYPDGRITARGTLPGGWNGLRIGSWSDYAARMKPGQGFVERITNPVIEVDGDVAMVWAPFTVSVGGKVLSCGIDHFDLVRESGRWKVLNITFSSRITGCQGQ